MPTTPSKEQQIAEGAARERGGTAPIPAGETALAIETVGDLPGQDPAVPLSAPGSGTTEPPPPAPKTVGGLFDAKREGIISKFRRSRGTEERDAPEEISEFARSGLPPEFAAEPIQPAEEPEVAAPAADLPAPRLPSTVKIKVYGQEREVPLEEALAKAQIAYASDNLLDEAKAKVREIDGLLAETRQRASRPAQEGQHQAPPNGTQTENVVEPTNPQHQGETRKLAEVIQFGDADEAEVMLRNTIAQSTDESVKRALYDQRLADEGARTNRVLQDFQAKHQDVANDPKAKAAIEVTMLQLQLDDLRAIGLDPNLIREDRQPPTAADISVAHRHYRATGYGVRSPEQMLQQALDDYNEWRGVAKETTADPAIPPTEKTTPRVIVTAERQERRAAVPQQPSRTTAPRPDPQQAAPTRDRSSVVNAMKKRNATLRGQNLGL